MDDGGLGGFWWIFSLVLVVVFLVASWKMYAKAGQHGWVAIIPIINVLGLLKIVHRPWWWILLMLVPIVNFVIWIILMVDLAKAFGHGVGMALVLIFFNVIGFLVLAFGSSAYQLEEDRLFG